MAEILHASCVAIDEKGLLIIGSTGSGKSSLALQLIAFGADLVADDRTELRVEDGRVKASAVPSISGLIEARGIGILNATAISDVTISLAIDMDQVEADRLPVERKLTLMGQSCPLLYKVEGIHLAASLWHLMRHGRSHR